MTTIGMILGILINDYDGIDGDHHNDVFYLFLTSAQLSSQVIPLLLVLLSNISGWRSTDVLMVTDMRLNMMVCNLVSCLLIAKHGNGDDACDDNDHERRI